MDLTLLSAALKESLLQSQSVVLPGVGTFTIAEIPSVFLNGGKTLTPPTREISFSANHLQNDGKLEAIFTRMAELTHEEGVVKMALLVEKIRTSIHVNRQACIPEFGTLRLDSEYQFHFTPDKDFCFAPDYYLLEPLSLKSELTATDVSVFIDENPPETDIWIIKDGEPQPEELPEPTPDTVVVPPAPAPASGIAPSAPALTPTSPPAAAPAPAPHSLKWLWITLSILGALVLACLFIYLFRTELTPLLEKLLYTPEELEILRATKFG